MKALREKGTRTREKLLNKPRTKVFQGMSLGQMAVKSRGMSVGLNSATRTIQIQVQVWKSNCSAYASESGHSFKMAKCGEEESSSMRRRQDGGSFFLSSVY